MRVCVSLVQCEQSEGCAREKTKYDCYDHFFLSLFTMPNENVFYWELISFLFAFIGSGCLSKNKSACCGYGGLIWSLGIFRCLVFCFASRLNCILHFLDSFLFSLNYRAAVVIGVVFSCSFRLSQASMAIELPRPFFLTCDSCIFTCDGFAAILVFYRKIEFVKMSLPSVSYCRAACIDCFIFCFVRFLIVLCRYLYAYPRPNIF